MIKEVNLSGDFFDNYKSTAEGGKYLSGDEKQVLIDNGVVFDITALTWEPENQYGARFVAFVTIPPANGDGEPMEAKIPFPFGTNVDSRDNMLKAMQEYFDKEDAKPVSVKLTKVGRAIHIVPGK